LQLTNVTQKLSIPFTSNEAKLSALMQEFWVNFAEFGDPNGAPTSSSVLLETGKGAESAAAWPPLQPSGATLLLSAQEGYPKVEAEYRKARCAVFPASFQEYE